MYEESYDEPWTHDSEVEFQRCKIFVKVEPVEPGKKPHLIFSRTDFYNVVMGPIYWQMATYIFHNMPCFVQSLSPDALARRMYDITHGFTYDIVSLDAKSWDSSLNEFHLKCEHNILSEFFGVNNFRMRLGDTACVTDPIGRRFEVTNCRSTGQQNTSLGNSLLSAVVCVAVYMHLHWVVDLSSVCIKGDDVAIAGHCIPDVDAFIRTAYDLFGITYTLQGIGKWGTVEVASTTTLDGIYASRMFSKALDRGFVTCKRIDTPSIARYRYDICVCQWFLNRNTPILGAVWRRAISLAHKRVTPAALHHRTLLPAYDAHILTEAAELNYEHNISQLARSNFSLSTGISWFEQKSFELIAKQARCWRDLYLFWPDLFKVCIELQQLC